MRELASKLEGGGMSARFHLASRASTSAAESYRMAKRRCKILGTLIVLLGILSAF